jgi:hypothetical protein
MRSEEDVRRVTELLAEGFTPTEVARRTGLPRSTIRGWKNGAIPRRPTAHASPCAIGLAEFDPAAYTYLFGLYLGDGCISAARRTFRLRVTLDAAYPSIVAECATAVKTLIPHVAVSAYRRPRSRCVDVGAYWVHWPCVFPQHGSGRKHLRPIELTPEQHEIVFAHPKQFLRGLIHSDGTRIVATERKGDAVRRAPRYAFSNMSGDILGMFCDACDAVGIHHTRASVKQVAIYRKDCVATLDQFVGPKS